MPREDGFFKIEVGAEEEDAEVAGTKTGVLAQTSAVVVETVVVEVVEAVVVGIGAHVIERAGPKYPGEGPPRKRKEWWACPRSECGNWQFLPSAKCTRSGKPIVKDAYGLEFAHLWGVVRPRTTVEAAAVLLCANHFVAMDVSTPWQRSAVPII